MLSTWRELERKWRERPPLEVNLADYDALLEVDLADYDALLDSTEEDDDLSGTVEMPGMEAVGA